MARDVRNSTSKHRSPIGMIGWADLGCFLVLGFVDLEPGPHGNHPLILQMFSWIGGILPASAVLAWYGMVLVVWSRFVRRRGIVHICSIIALLFMTAAIVVGSFEISSRGIGTW